MSATRLLVLGVVRTLRAGARLPGPARTAVVGRGRLGECRAGSIYHAMKKLAKDRYLTEVGNEEGGAGPERVVYALTEDGETEFRQLLAKALSATRYDAEETFASIAFMTALPRAQAIGLLVSGCGRWRTACPELRRLAGHPDDMGKPAHVLELFRHWRYSADAEVRWTKELIGRLEAGEYVMADDSPEHFGRPAGGSTARSGWTVTA